MSAAHSSLMENIGDTDLDPGPSQEGSTENLLVKPSVARRRANLQEVENVYTTVSPPPPAFRVSLFGPEPPDF